MKVNVDDGLTAGHDAMVTAFMTAMPWLKTVDAYQPLAGGQVVVSPAVLIEAVEMQPGRKASNGKTPIDIEFAAHCILSVTTPRVEIAIRNFAALMIQFIDGNRWGLGDNIERPTELSAWPGMFKPDDKGFESWVVGWKQTFHLGEVLLEPDYQPAEVLIGEYPNIGPGHEPDYAKG